MWTLQFILEKGNQWVEGKNVPVVFSCPVKFVFTLEIVTNIPGLPAIYPLTDNYVLPILGKRKLIELSMVPNAGHRQLKKEDKCIVKRIQERTIGLVRVMASFSQTEIRNTPSESSMMQSWDLVP